MRKYLLLLFWMALLLPAHSLWAQTRPVTGTVTGADGAALPGVTVLAKGTAVGTATNADGRYELAVPAGATTLVFSFVGYDTRQVAIGEKTSINVALTANTTGLDEIVVVGYGTQSRRDLTGNVATISGKEIKSLPVQSFDQAL